MTQTSISLLYSIFSSWCFYQQMLDLGVAQADIALLRIGSIFNTCLSKVALHFCTKRDATQKITATVQRNQQ